MLPGGEVQPDIAEEIFLRLFGGHHLEGPVIQKGEDGVPPVLVGPVRSVAPYLPHVMALAGDVVVRLANPCALPVLHQAHGVLIAGQAEQPRLSARCPLVPRTSGHPAATSHGLHRHRTVHYASAGP